MFATKRVVLTLALIFAAISLLSSTQTWISCSLDPNASASSTVTISGNVAAPLAFALSLVLFAGIIAATLARGWVRAALFMVTALAGFGVFAVALVVSLDPIQFVQQIVTEATGLVGADTIAAIVVDIRQEFWLYLTLAGGFVAGVVTGYAAFTSRVWVSTGRRYSTTTSKSSPREQSSEREAQRSDSLADDRIGDWDALSEGRDPSRENSAVTAQDDSELQ